MITPHLIYIVALISHFHCHSYCFHHCIIPEIEVIWILMDLSKIINNVIGQLT